MNEAFEVRPQPKSMQW